VEHISNKKDKKVKKLNFLRGISRIPAGDVKTIKSKIMTELDISEPSYYLKKKGATVIKPLEKKEIERIFSEYNIDPWTGKPILGQVRQFLHT